MASVSLTTTVNVARHRWPSDALYRKLKVEHQLGRYINDLGVTRLRYDAHDYSCPFNQLWRKLSSDVEVACAIRDPIHHRLSSWNSLDKGVKAKIIRHASRSFPGLYEFDEAWPAHRICSVAIYNKRVNERETNLRRILQSNDGKFTRKECISMYNERVVLLFVLFCLPFHISL
jgi:hypothetical protein